MLRYEGLEVAYYVFTLRCLAYGSPDSCKKQAHFNLLQWF